VSHIAYSQAQAVTGCAGVCWLSMWKSWCAHGNYKRNTL